MTPDEEDVLPPEIAQAFEAWFSKLTPEADDMSGLLNATASHEGRPGWLQVYAPGSIVCRRGAQGLLIDIEIVGPKLFSSDDGMLKLFYRYKSSAGIKALTPADQVEAIGDQWPYTYWNPGTNEYVDELDDLAPRNVDRPIALSDSISEPET